MIIIALKQKGNNIIVYFDNGESIILDYRTVMDFGLRKNDDIDETLKEKLISESVFLKAKDSAFRFLGRRQHSVLEVKTKLLQKRIDKEIVDKVINNFLSNGFLDDSKFVQAYIEERTRKKVGVTKLRTELFKKGISREIVKEALDNIDQEISYEHAQQLAMKKLESLKRRETDNRKIKAKLFSFLNSKGYESEIVMKVINSLSLSESYDENTE